MAIKCIVKDRGRSLTFGDVGSYQFFADSDNDLMFKISETHALYFENNNIVRYEPNERVLRIIDNLEIREL